MIASDGLPRNVTHEEIVEYLQKYPGSEEAAKYITKKARENESVIDDITLMVINIS